MNKFSALLVLVLTSMVVSLPVERSENDVAEKPQEHVIEKRFINTMFSSEAKDSDDPVKIRAKRSEEDCKKLQLCKLHARANRNFFSAFQLYFVNKENARLWDHQSRSAAACQQTYRGGCYK